MLPLIKRNLKRAKLVYLWITRILLAPNRFGVSLFTRLRFACFGGYVADQVALYDLKRQPRGTYLSEFDWYRSRWINEPFDSMLNNKIVCNEILQHHIKVPRIFYVKNKGRVKSLERPDALRAIDEVLETLQHEGTLFLKPLGSGRGKGVHRLDAELGAFQLDRRQVPAESIRELLTEEDGWFLSEGIEQHPDIARLYPDTSNTVRLITLRDPHGGELKIFFAVMRIGTAETVPVDNGSRGGLVAKIDLDSGVLTEARTLWSNESHAVHPDSGTPILGSRVPEWTAVITQVMDVARAFPYLQFIAWDILIAEDGPYIIEANTSSGVNIIQIWGAQGRGELGDFYRAHGVIR